MTFLDALREQRWDDHRYYHHSRINQSLHFVSALCFLSSYALIFIDPVAAVLIGWFCAMLSRQIGHFFFEPKSYDLINDASHEHKEDIKVGYNLQRKIVLLSIWALAPLALSIDPTLVGLFAAPTDSYGFLHNLCVLWLLVGIGAVLARTLHLCIVRDVQTGLVWCTKILTDPFHDVKIYWKSPLYLLRGERFDPMTPWAEPASRA